jgi:hypothetical protein
LLFLRIGWCYFSRNLKTKASLCLRGELPLAYLIFIINSNISLHFWIR